MSHVIVQVLQYLFEYFWEYQLPFVTNSPVKDSIIKPEFLPLMQSLMPSSSCFDHLFPSFVLRLWGLNKSQCSHAGWPKWPPFCRSMGCLESVSASILAFPGRYLISKLKSAKSPTQRCPMAWERIIICVNWMMGHSIGSHRIYHI